MQYINIPAGTTYPLILGEDILAMNTSKIYLQCDTVGAGAINILLPKITIPAGGSIKNWFLEIFVNDIGNNASGNNIKITPAPSDTINGSGSQIILSTNGATGRIVITGKTAWDFSVGNAGSGSGIPYGNDTGVVDAYKVSLANATLTAGYTFEVRIKTGNDNTGALATMQVNAFPVKPLVDSDLNPLAPDMMEGDSIYLFTYNLEADKYQLLGLAKPSSCITDVTYANLVSLMSSNGLSVGRSYRITDFRTRELIPNTSDIITGAIEPLIVQAIRTNAIDEENALSTLYPKDTIYYQVVNTSTSADDRGRIYFRSDTIINVSAWYDWRVIVFRRWETSVGSGIYTLLTDPAGGEAFLDFYTFNNSPSAVDCYSTSLGAITNLGIATSPFAPTDRLNNIVFYGKCYDNTFGSDCYENTIGRGVGLNPTLGATNGNTIGHSFINNTIGNSFRENTIGNQFQRNQISYECIGNVVQHFFQDNSIGYGFASNLIAPFFVFNSIENTFVSNEIMSNFSYNIIGTAFRFNKIGANVFFNNILNNCEYNEIGSNFFANTGIQNGFKLNHIESLFTPPVSFALATHVYQSYTFEIKKVAVNSYLGYYYTFGAPPVVTITSVLPNS